MENIELIKSIDKLIIDKEKTELKIQSLKWKIRDINDELIKKIIEIDNPSNRAISCYGLLKVNNNSLNRFIKNVKLGNN